MIDRTKVQTNLRNVKVGDWVMYFPNNILKKGEDLFFKSFPNGVLVPGNIYKVVGRRIWKEETELLLEGLRRRWFKKEAFYDCNIARDFSITPIGATRRKFSGEKGLSASQTLDEGLYWYRRLGGAETLIRVEESSGEKVVKWFDTAIGSSLDNIPWDGEFISVLNLDPFKLGYRQTRGNEKRSNKSAGYGFNWLSLESWNREMLVFIIEKNTLSWVFYNPHKPPILLDKLPRSVFFRIAYTGYEST